MKKHYNKSLFRIGFMLNIIRNLILLIPGIILCIIGIWVKPCLFFGLVLFTIDVVISFIQQVRIKKGVESNSDPNFEPWADIMSKDNWRDEVINAVNEIITKQSSSKLHLFNEAMKDTCPNYLGLYTLLNLPEDCYQEMELEYSGNYPYTEENVAVFMRICSYLELQSIRSKLILFSDNMAVNAPDSFAFIGYDICADSEWYSPLGDGFLKEYDNSVFFSEMGLDEFKAFQNDINESGLFSSHDKAVAFAEYCNCINNKYPGVVETEDNWRPFIVYLFERS